MDTDLKAALRSGAARYFTAVKIEYPDFTLRLVNAGFVVIDGDTYLARDDTYGTLGLVERIGDGSGQDAPRCRIQLKPPSAAAMSALTDPEAQLSPLTVFWGCVNVSTGEVIGVPEEPFIGLLDEPRFSMDRNSWGVTLDCCSGLDRALDSTEGLRLAPAFQNTVWPSETSFDQVTGVDDPVYWGMRPPAGSIFTGGGTSPGFVGRLVSNL